MSESHANLSERVVWLEAERDIVQRLHSYCHVIDHGTDDEFLDCFTDDAVWTMRFRGSVGEQQFSGRRAFREFIEKIGPARRKPCESTSCSSQWCRCRARLRRP